MHNKQYSFIKKVMTYDDDVSEIVTDVFFQSFTFDNPETDVIFKKTFINRFLNRKIQTQSIEDFSSQLLYYVLSHKNFIETVYGELDKYLLGETISDTKTGNNRSSDSRFLASDLPQDNINLNVDNTVLNYGNQNTISRSKETGSNDSKTVNTQYNLATFLETKELLNTIFDEIDQFCFLQVF